ncbi:MAG: PTS sugar transporter subunit IIC [Deltaproteobacteria bacterium]|jgi:mannose/fructose/N-acetylgalactosamine-specific phosphotransferase system component IIC|nr:PTS sugar transporter subunit IIC [Deltaproteobacteria bacterium]
MTTGFFGALLLAALLNLDRQAVAQFGLARPIVTGALMGLFTGQVTIGLNLGFWTELLWLTRPPLGGHVSPNGGLAVSSAILGALLLGENLPPERLAGASVLLFAVVIPLAHLLTNIETVTRGYSLVWTKNFKEAISSLRSPSALSFQLRGVALVMLLGFISAIMGAVIFGLYLKLCLAYLPELCWVPLTRFAPLAPLIGIATMTERLNRLHAIVFLIFFVISLIVLRSTAS